MTSPTGQTSDALRPAELATLHSCEAETPRARERCCRCRPMACFSPEYSIFSVAGDFMEIGDREAGGNEEVLRAPHGSLDNFLFAGSAEPHQPTMGPTALCIEWAVRSGRRRSTAEPPHSASTLGQIGEWPVARRHWRGAISGAGVAAGTPCNATPSTIAAWCCRVREGARDRAGQTTAS